MVDCPRMHARLSVRACVLSYEKRVHLSCIGCQLGPDRGAQKQKRAIRVSPSGVIREQDYA